MSIEDIIICLDDFSLNRILLIIIDSFDRNTDSDQFAYIVSKKFLSIKK